ncbi:MAG: Nif11-like leader peptide family natural product precursor [Candidatus Hydrogenedentes bacterium]|nr:Nif11-like leader peptide family natural product precursor [Candidatus Hydrogenedentota bacterium]
MSQSNATAFISRIGESPALQEAVNGFQGKGGLAHVVKLGAECGFDFTEEDYRAAVVELADGALSDESLDEVLREVGLNQ